MQEKRQYERCDIDMPAQCRLSSNPDCSYDTSVINISGEGLGIVSSALFKKYDTIEIKLKLEDVGDVVIKAQVMWKKEIAVECYSCGDTIIDADHKDHDKFIHFYVEKMLLVSKKEGA